MNVSLSTLYKWTEPTSGGSGIPNPLDRIVILISKTGNTEIAEWIAGKANGFYVQNISTKKQISKSVNHATNQLVREFAEMISTIASTSCDGSISNDESIALRKRWGKLQSVTESFVRHCEEGNFDLLKNQIKLTKDEIVQSNMKKVMIESSDRKPLPLASE